MYIFNHFVENLFTLLVGCLTIFPKNNNYELMCSSVGNLLEVEPMPYVDRLSIISRMRLPDVLREEHVKNFKQIKTLFVNHGVSEIEDEALRGLKNLRKIFFGNCNVPVIKATYFDNPNLEHITFDDSNVTDIEPKAFSKLPSAKEAAITNNKIRVIRKGIFENTPFQDLNLQYNQIEIIEEGAFFGMANLTSLELNNNLLKTFNSELIIGESTSLAYFELSSNKLTEVTNSMTRTLSNLLRFNLLHNSIKNIQCCSLKQLERLEHLDLSSNQIEELDPSLFDVKNSIAYLYLNRNKLSCISEELLKKLSHLKYLAAFVNPWEPTCKIRTRTYLSQRNIINDCDHFQRELKRVKCFSSYCYQYKDDIEKNAKNYCS